MTTHPPPPEPPVLDRGSWWYRGMIMPWAKAHARYHRVRLEGGPPPSGPCVYVALHGAGYFVMDLVMACYAIGWEGWYERGETLPMIRIVTANSKIERAIPGLPTVKRHFGCIDTSEASALAVLRRGEQLLVTPGGMREAQPHRDFYDLRWDGRYGFVRLALQTGVPIVPLAVVGGAEAYPGLRWKKLSFWSPFPLPARFDMAMGEPIPVELAPEKARDLSVVKPIHALAWSRTQALYDDLVARRKAK